MISLSEDSKKEKKKWTNKRQKTRVIDAEKTGICQRGEWWEEERGEGD